MIDEGEMAPGFDLPAVNGGEFERVSLDEHLGEDVVILAFYPGDFNPACEDTSSGLDDLDLFTMQKDLTILAVSGDSVFSHRAFAREYDLHFPLLADVRGEVAAEYGVAADGDRYATRRAVFVIDHTERIEYAWLADDVDDIPVTDEMRAVVENIGDDRTALARYRVGRAHYVEGRRAFTSAMNEYDQRGWVLSSRDFAQAADEFDKAREEFNTAVRFSDDEKATRYFERAERKAEALWRAAGWLNDSADAFASGKGRRGDELRADAEDRLETARDIHEPPDPDDFPPEQDPDEDPSTSLRPSSDVDNTLDMDESAVREETAEPTDAGSGQTTTDSPDGATTDEPPDSAPEQFVETPDEATAVTGGDGQPGDDIDHQSSDDIDHQSSDDIDDEELEAITAELEQQNDAGLDDSTGEAADATGATGEPVSTRTESGESDVAAEDDDVDDDLELELSDPTDGDRDEENEGEYQEGGDETDEGAERGDEEEEEDGFGDIDGGDHGVPDSL